MSIIKKYCVLFLFSVAMVAPVRAGGIPVFDAIADILRATQYALQQNQYSEAIKRLQELKNTVDALSGDTDIGDFLNTDKAKELRRYLPEDMQGLLDAFLGGEDAVNESINAYIEKYSNIPGTELYVDDGLLNQYDNHLNTTIISDVAANSSYDGVEGRLTNIEKIMEKINSADTTKKQLDVVARLQAENAFLLVELIRLNSLTLKAQSASMQKEHTSVESALSSSAYRPSYGSAGSGSGTAKEVYEP